MKILWIGSAVLVGMGALGALTHTTTGSLLKPDIPSTETASEVVEIEGEKFAKTKDGRYKVKGVPTLFIDNSRVHTKYLSFNDNEEKVKGADIQAPKPKKNLNENATELVQKIEEKGILSTYNPETAAQFAETLKQTQEQAKERKKTLDELAQ